MNFLLRTPQKADIKNQQKFRCFEHIIAEKTVQNLEIFENRKACSLEKSGRLCRKNQDMTKRIQNCDKTVSQREKPDLEVGLTKRQKVPKIGDEFTKVENMWRLRG